MSVYANKGFLTWLVTSDISYGPRCNKLHTTWISSAGQNWRGWRSSPLHCYVCYGVGPNVVSVRFSRSFFSINASVAFLTLMNEWYQNRQLRLHLSFPVEIWRAESMKGSSLGKFYSTNILSDLVWSTQIKSLTAKLLLLTNLTSSSNAVNLFNLPIKLPRII